MAPKRAKLYSYGGDERCNEIRKFIEEAGILLDVRDLEKQPLTRWELSQLVGNLNLDHFINKASEAYDKHHLDKASLSRNELLDIIAEDNSLLRRPIIQSSRLLTIGCDKKKISEMLQINGSNGHQDNVPDNRGNRRVAASSR